MACGGRGGIIRRGSASRRVNGGQACVPHKGGIQKVADEIEERKSNGTREQKQAGVGRHL